MEPEVRRRKTWEPQWRTMAFLYWFGETAKLSKDGRYYYYLVLLLVVGRLMRTPSLLVHSTICASYFHLPPNPEHTFLFSPHPLISIGINKTQWGNGRNLILFYYLTLEELFLQKPLGLLCGQWWYFLDKWIAIFCSIKQLKSWGIKQKLTRGKKDCEKFSLRLFPTSCPSWVFCTPTRYHHHLI